MTRFFRHPGRWHAAWAVALTLGVFWVLALAASPGLHERVHSDAGHHHDHDCAVTLFLSGAVGLFLIDPGAVARPGLRVLYAACPRPPAAWVISPVTRSVLEHGPPRLPSPSILV